MDFVDSDKKSWKSCPGVLNCIYMCQLFQRNIFFCKSTSEMRNAQDKILKVLFRIVSMSTDVLTNVSV